ncbi:Hypothetical predicted protein, partial [Paramuricea clavata]
CIHAGTCRAKRKLNCSRPSQIRQKPLLFDYAFHLNITDKLGHSVYKLQTYRNDHKGRLDFIRLYIAIIAKDTTDLHVPTERLPERSYALPKRERRKLPSTFVLILGLQYYVANIDVVKDISNVPSLIHMQKILDLVQCQAITQFISDFVVLEDVRPRQIQRRLRRFPYQQQKHRGYIIHSRLSHLVSNSTSSTTISGSHNSTSPSVNYSIAICTMHYIGHTPSIMTDNVTASAFNVNNDVTEECYHDNYFGYFMFGKMTMDLIYTMRNSITKNHEIVFTQLMTSDNKVSVIRYKRRIVLTVFGRISDNCPSISRDRRDWDAMHKSFKGLTGIN